MVVGAAGNGGQDTPVYPAALDGVVAVARYGPQRAERLLLEIRSFAYDAHGNSARTPEIRVFVTAGIGLLVRGVSLGPNRRMGTDTLSITGLFALPGDVEFDPGTEAVSIDVTGTHGTVLSITLPAGSLVRSRRGALRYSGPSAIPGDDVTVNIAKKIFGNAYSVKIADANATIANADPSWNLQMVVGTQVVMQSVALRATRSRWVLP